MHSPSKPIYHLDLIVYLRQEILNRVILDSYLPLGLRIGWGLGW
jgi:hypothetical protein